LLFQVALDQSIAAPSMLALFFSATTLMAGGSTTDVKHKIEESWWPTLLTSWKGELFLSVSLQRPSCSDARLELAVWIPVQAINMAFVPPQQRLLFVNVVNLGWNTYLSL
jgi:protein Mpv17